MPARAKTRVSQQGLGQGPGAHNKSGEKRKGVCDALPVRFALAILVIA